MAGIAARAAVEFRHLPRRDWFLTIVATVREKGASARLCVVSCLDRPGKAPLSHPLDHFEVNEISTAIRRELIFGFARSVSSADRKYLKQLNRGSADPAELRRALARINGRSATNSNGAISEGCLVTTTMPDGSIASENFGRIPGITIDKAGSTEMLEVIAEAQSGKRPVFVQSRGLAQRGVSELTLGPMNISKGSTLVVKVAADLVDKVAADFPPPFFFLTDSGGGTFRTAPQPHGAKVIDHEAEWAKIEAKLREETLAGPAHKFTFTSTSGSFTFNGPDGSQFGVMKIDGMSGEAVVMENRVSKIILGMVTVQAFPTFGHQGEALRTHWDVRSVPTIDGVQPHGWTYTVDMLLDASGGLLSVRQNSVALRSANFSSPLSCLTDTEELVVVSSIRPAIMKLSEDEPSASGYVEARLLLRSIRSATSTSC